MFCIYWHKSNGICWRNSFPCDTKKYESCALFKQKMSTNFYINTKKYGKLHIGKQSIGWYFILHIYPEKDINELIDLISLFGQGEIFDEYGHKVDEEKMLEIILNNQKSNVIHRNGEKVNESYCVCGENGLKRIAEQKEGAFGLYTLETRDFC